MATGNHLLNFNNARNALQVTNMRKIVAEGFCPFCPEHLHKYHEPPVLKKGVHWFITPNMYPYQHTRFHFLFITQEHVTDSKALSPEMWSELHELLQWIISEYSIECGTLIMRSGDMNKTGATVLHLHAQFVVGSDPNKPVITRVG